MFINPENIDPPTGRFSENYFYQELLSGAEATVCFVGSDAIGLSETCAPGDIITHDQKWDLGLQSAPPKRDWHFFPDIPDKWIDGWMLSVKAWRLLMGYDPSRVNSSYGRVDIRLREDGRCNVIDMNPNAYLGSDGLMCSCYRASGKDQASLIGDIANRAGGGF